MPVRAPPVVKRAAPNVAAEEADAVTQQDNWDNEGGHMSSLSGRVVHTPHARFPYKVVLSHHGSADSALVGRGRD